MAGRLARLEPLSLAHTPELVAAATEQPGAYRFNVVPTDEAAMTAYVEAALARRLEGNSLAFATVRLDDERVVGSTRFTRAERWPWPPGSSHERTDGSPDVVEIGYTWLAPSAQRTGVNVEAKLLMLEHAFESWNVRRVSLVTDARNDRSRAAIEALGAGFEGIIRAHRIASDGTVRDSARFSIVASEWPAVRERLTSRLASHPERRPRAGTPRSDQSERGPSSPNSTVP